MEADLEAKPGRVFIGPIEGRVQIITVKSVRKRRDGTVSSVKAVWESGDVLAEASMGMPKDGMMRGFRRVTMAQYGTARQMTQVVGHSVPTDAFVIVTQDRCVDGTPEGIFKTGGK